MCVHERVNERGKEAQKSCVSVAAVTRFFAPQDFFCPFDIWLRAWIGSALTFFPINLRKENQEVKNKYPPC